MLSQHLRREKNARFKDFAQPGSAETDLNLRVMAGDSRGKPSKTVTVRIFIRKRQSQVSEMGESLFDGELDRLF